MIETIHKEAVKIVLASKEPTDNGTANTKRNVTITNEQTIDAFMTDEDDYAFNNGLIDENSLDHKIKNFRFIQQEWQDWKDGLAKGESKSQHEYPEHWKGSFDAYCYSDRFGKYLTNQIENIKSSPESRQNFLAIWTKEDEGNAAIPCTIGYNIQVVDKVAYCSFVYRSVEVAYNFVNDLWLNKEYIKMAIKDMDIDKVNVTYFILNAHRYPKEWDT